MPNSYFLRLVNIFTPYHAGGAHLRLSHGIANWQAACCTIVDCRDKFRALLSTAADLSTFTEEKNQDNK